METETNLVFVNLDTDTAEDLAGDAFVINTETAVLSDSERDVLGWADQFGAFNDDAAAIVRRVGVPVADLWAAYQWRQKILAAMGEPSEWCPVGELSGDRHRYSVGDGVVVPWDVAGDPRPNVEVCRECSGVPA